MSRENESLGLQSSRTVALARVKKERRQVCVVVDDRMRKNRERFGHVGPFQTCNEANVTVV